MEKQVKNPTQDLLPFEQHELPELQTIRKAAAIIGVEYRHLLEAVQNGEVPVYRLGKSRRLVRVPEVLEIMKNKSE